jgi:hypothetical protein
MLLIQQVKHSCSLVIVGRIAGELGEFEKLELHRAHLREQ